MTGPTLEELLGFYAKERSRREQLEQEVNGLRRHLSSRDEAMLERMEECRVLRKQIAELKESHPQYPQDRVRHLTLALRLVRDVLDDGVIPGGSANSERLFRVEGFLSRELGNPVWEGRRS